MRSFLFKLGEDENQTSEYDRLQEALSELSPEQLEDFQHSAGATPRLDSLTTKMAEADRMGREMAHEHHLDLFKEAAWQAGVAKALTGKVMPAASKLMGQAAANPKAALAIGGAGVGALGGAIKDPGVDPQTGQKKSRLKNIALGAGLGAGAGAALGHSGKVVGAVKGLPGKMAPKMEQFGQKATAWGQKAEQAAAIPKATASTAPIKGPKPAPSPMGKPTPAAAPPAAPQGAPTAPSPAVQAAATPPAGGPPAGGAPQPAAAPVQAPPPAAAQPAAQPAAAQGQTPAAYDRSLDQVPRSGIAGLGQRMGNAVADTTNKVRSGVGGFFENLGQKLRPSPQMAPAGKKKFAAICARYGVTKTASRPMTRLEQIIKQAQRV